MDHGTVQLTAAEQEMIAKQTAKDAAKLSRLLRHVRKTGFPTSQTVNELLSVNGLIEFGRPTESIQYNHYRLTARAQRFLATADWKRFVKHAAVGCLRSQARIVQRATALALQERPVS